MCFEQNLNFSFISYFVNSEFEVLVSFVTLPEYVLHIASDCGKLLLYCKYV